MQIIERLLPANCYSSKNMVADAIVLHYISAINIDKDKKFDMELCRKILQDYEISCHYMVSREGVIWQLAPETKRAFHAGKSEYKGRTSWNDFSIGIEFLGTKDSGFTDEQYSSGKKLIAWLIDQFPITSIVGHEDIAGFRGKIDPGISTGNFQLNRVI